MDILILGDTVRSPELRHEIPLGIPDPFLYLERDGRRGLMISSLELPRVKQLGGLEIMAPEELGMDELFAQGMERERIGLELSLRACKRFGVTSAAVPHTFPLEYADYLREGGVELKADRKVFEQRRRVKNDAELEGIRRAQRAAEAGMEAARDLLRRAAPTNGNGALSVDGEPLTSERIKRAIDEAFIANDCGADEFIVSHGPQSAVGHDMGSGQIVAGEPIVIDLWPRDRESACFADMTRTFVVGEPTDEVKEWHRLVKEALDQAIGAIRPGVKGFDLFKQTCDLFQEHGYPTQLSKEPGTVLADGFFHGLGHGVGLEVHEEPGMGLGAKKELVAGDVVTIEPGLYRTGYGGCRLEDLVLVTEDGAENLTKFSYDLAP